jgi:hypothetical protein
MTRSLRAVRPITASHAVAIAFDRRLSPDQLADRARAYLAQLPAGVTVTPELAQKGQAVLRQVAEWLIERARATSTIQDRRFAHVADFLAYYQNQWQETCDAWNRGDSR